MKADISRILRVEDPELVNLLEQLDSYGLGACILPNRSRTSSQARSAEGRREEIGPRICYDRIIPDDLREHQIVARNALFSTALRQTEARSTRLLLADLDPSQPISAVRMAIINRKIWGAGSTLKCRFLDGTKAQRERTVEKARLWEEHANLRIDFVTSKNEQIRISFTPDQGSWSAIGTDALNTQYFPKHQPTMNFGWLTDSTDDTEYERVVVHEFGHALGAIHEHQSPTERLDWNVKEVYKYFSGAPNFWSKEEIDHNVLQRYSPNGITPTVFDKDSIMLYQFPDFLFNDHRGTPNNTSLSDKDKQLIAQMYPH